MNLVNRIEALEQALNVRTITQVEREIVKFCILRKLIISDEHCEEELIKLIKQGEKILNELKSYEEQCDLIAALCREIIRQKEYKTGLVELDTLWQKYAGDIPLLWKNAL